ncbi:MAG TPA: hypothetical protein VHR42_04580, partial [Clostridia bacterium]|nr:hypothetical protein [Clostridia bacterium]
ADKESAERVIQELQRRLDEMKKSLEAAEKAYIDVKSRLEGDRAVLSDQLNRRETLAAAVLKARDDFLEKCAAYGFASEERYREAYLDESGLASLQKQVTDYRSACTQAESELNRLNEETRDRKPQDTMVMQEEKRRIEEEKKAYRRGNPHAVGENERE